MSRSILYYPSMDIEDGVWLRNAMLYWDKIHSIVPSQFMANYSAEVQELKDRKIYSPISPDVLFDSDEKILFENEVKNKIRRLNKRNQLREINYNGERTMMHYKKIPKDICNLMVELGVLHLHTGSEWTELEENTANLYMSTMAEYLVKISSSDMIVGTDKNKYIYQAYEHHWHNQRSMCLTSVFENAMPTPNLDVSFETILDFREKREAELLHLRKEIRDFENNLAICRCWEEIKATTNEFREKWECELLDMDKMLKDHGIRYRLGTMKSLIEITDGAASLMQFVNDHLRPMTKYVIGAGLATAGLIGVGTNHVDHRRRLKEGRNNASFAYLYEAAEKGIIRRASIGELI